MSTKQTDLLKKKQPCNGSTHTVCLLSSDLGDLAHAAVTGLPAETVGPAEIPDVSAAGDVLPQHTAPGPEFGTEVGSAAGLAVGRGFKFPSHHSSFLKTSQASSFVV